MKLILFGFVCFGVGVFLADFIKAQIAKLERKNG